MENKVWNINVEDCKYVINGEGEYLSYTVKSNYSNSHLYNTCISNLGLKKFAYDVSSKIMKLELLVDCRKYTFAFNPTKLQRFHLDDNMSIGERTDVLTALSDLFWKDLNITQLRFSSSASKLKPINCTFSLGKGWDADDVDLNKVEILTNFLYDLLVEEEIRFNDREKYCVIPLTLSMDANSTLTKTNGVVLSNLLVRDLKLTSQAHKPEYGVDYKETFKLLVKRKTLEDIVKYTLKEVGLVGKFSTNDSVFNLEEVLATCFHHIFTNDGVVKYKDYDYHEVLLLIGVTGLKDDITTYICKDIYHGSIQMNWNYY